MKPRAFVVAVLMAAAAAYGVAKLLSYKPLLQTNRARWLVHQGKWDEARIQLAEVRRSAPDYERAEWLLALVFLNTGRYEDAAREIEGLSDSARRDFLRGALAYVSSREEEARIAFAAAEKRPSELEPWMLRLVRLATGAARVTDEQPAGVAGERKVPLERMLWNAFLARSLYSSRQYEDSRPYFQKAWAAQDRNHRTMVMGAAAHAATGEYARAQLYADRAPSRREFLHSIAAEADRMSSATATSVSPTIQQALGSDEMRLRFARVKAWAAVTDAGRGNDAATSRALAVTEQLLAEAPRDLVAETLHGDALEIAGRLSEAFVLYSRAFQRNPAYPLLLRIRDLTGPDATVRRREAEFLRGPQVVAYVPAESMQTSQTKTRRGHLAFFDQGSAVAEFSVPADGKYEIALIAAGDRAFGLSPVVTLNLDGQRAGDIYIAREGWDVYSHRASLAEGRHRLELKYINDSERRPSPDEDRNLYLQGVLVMRAGGH